MSAVLPSGSPARAGNRPSPDGATPETTAPESTAPESTAPESAAAPNGHPDSGSTASGTGGRLARWPRTVRVPLQVAGQTLAKAWHDRILGLSAEAAFWQILSVPPLLIGLLGSMGYVGNLIGHDRVQEVEDRLVNASARALTPDVVDSLVRPTLKAILGSGRLDVVSIGFVLSLWAGSSATATFMNTTVIAYDQRDVRGPIRTRLMALWLFVLGLVGAVIVLPLLVLGPGLLVGLFPTRWQDTALLLVNAVYWPVVVVGLVLALTSFFHVMLPRRIPWRRHLPGAMLAVAFFVISAWVLRYYVADFLTTSLPYGALATPIAALLFCFFFGMAILLGAELNATIQQGWPAPLRRHEKRRQRRRQAKLESERKKLGPGPASAEAPAQPLRSDS
jgi:membrane protein